MATNKGYTTVADPDTSAKAKAKEQPISPKNAREVAGMIRGMKVPTAQKALQSVIAMETPVKLRRYNKQVAHKKGVGPGKYPVKVSQAILEVLNSAAANADFKGLDSTNMAISTITVARGAVIPGHRPRAQGRATQWNQDTVNIEIIISEVE
ncbi:MAG: 50S ribosomal protein L22 [Candidatus Methanomethylophilus sp.]|jgi:large subunit ribosomal protein L22|nr:50S ribosomal protein L22 [Methanomethylophilus sp.]MDD3232733.1 50S ribosomal protein L22 [Methanomethylophilus sp.]MDD4221734.1 50S ribosomal protein L22 [Methanomethylophilus sp.]MDD4668418.1 50S ribosomal protein L22 [Methanomethylophilus sp.]